MKPSFYTAYTAMTAYQRSLDVLSHNLANVNTTGYKEVRATFSELLYSNMNQKSDESLLRGSGIKLARVDTKFDEGVLRPTGYEFDFAILGDGFFAVSVDEDNQIFTRDGAFSVGEGGGAFYLTQLDGSYVLDKDFQRIPVEWDPEYGGYDMEKIKEKIAIFHFDNMFELEHVGANAFRATEKSGEPFLVETGNDVLLYQGGLEQSTVNMGESMIVMLENQRAFQLNARVLQTSDEIEEMVNNLRR